MSRKRGHLGANGPLSEHRGRNGVGEQPSEPVPDPVSEAKRALDEVQKRIASRRALGLYRPHEDDTPAFVDLVLEDDLAAAANRLAAAARIEGLAPSLYVPAPHEGLAVSQDHDSSSSSVGGSSRTARDRAEGIGQKQAQQQGGEGREGGIWTVPQSAQNRSMIDIAASLARRALRVLVGERVDTFIEQSLRYFAETASFATSATCRIVELERRVDALEQMVAAGPEPSGAGQEEAGESGKRDDKSTKVGSEAHPAKSSPEES